MWEHGAQEKATDTEEGAPCMFRGQVRGREVGPGGCVPGQVLFPYSGGLVLLAIALQPRSCPAHSFPGADCPQVPAERSWSPWSSVAWGRMWGRAWEMWLLCEDGLPMEAALGRSGWA